MQTDEYPRIINKLKDYLEGSFSDYIEIFREMVSINSHTANPAGVNDLGDYTAGLFENLGFTIERVPSEHSGFGRHLVCTRNGVSTDSIALVSHLDTVYSPEEELERDFNFIIEGDRAYGPGTCDIKGGTLVIFMMLKAVSECFPDFYGSVSWRILMDASEEVDSDDFGRLCLDRLDESTRACLVFESGVFSNGVFPLVTARKGRAVFEIDVFGKAAHAGTSHHEGTSAVLGLCSVVRQLSGLTDYSMGVTVNVGAVSGGTEVNRVPDHARAEMEMRAFDSGAYNEARDAILSFNREAGPETLNCSVRVKEVRSMPAWPVNEGSEHLLSVWQRAASKMGYEAVPEHRGGLSDGNLLWQSLPVIDGMGPDGGNAHCSGSPSGDRGDREYAILSSFVPKAVLNVLGLMELMGSRGPEV